MNEIFKKSISEKLMKALHDESITTNGCGRLLGVNPTYISMIKNPKLWGKCSPATWETMLQWVNSGQRLQEYGEKHGVALPPKVISVKPIKASEVAKNEIDALHKNLSNHKSDDVKVEQKKLSIGQMVDLLLEEKALLKQKLDAIDTLLKFYIS